MARELHGPLDLNGNPITGLPLTPTVDTEAASKAYVDAAAGTGSDEVAISPDQPVAVGLELWIDTDAPPLSGGGGVSDHGALTGLADDDHPQYALADGTRGTFEVAGAVAAHAATAGHEPLASTTPAALGSATVGVGTTAARADHVHQMPTAANVGADPAGTASSTMTSHTVAADPHPQYLTQTEGDGRYSQTAHNHDHGALTGLADDDHTQYALVVVAAAKPGSPRVGTLWVPTG